MMKSTDKFKRELAKKLLEQHDGVRKPKLRQHDRSADKREVRDLVKTLVCC